VVTVATVNHWGTCRVALPEKYRWPIRAESTCTITPCFGHNALPLKPLLADSYSLCDHELMSRISAALLAFVATALMASSQPNPANQRGAAVSVPFVGCKSFGQIERLEAPKGTSRAVPIKSTDALVLAYYRSADGIGILAPRGWYCEGASGSGGYSLFLSPKPIQNRGSGWEGLDGPAIEVNHMTSGASGAYEIAEVMARVFPAYRAFASRVFQFMDLQIPASPYPKDTLTHRGQKIVEYNTPAQTDGLGNFHSWLRKNDLPISGAAIITGDPPNVRDGPDLVLLSLRMPPSLTGVIRVIVGQFESDTTGARP
jgi:hypothetical protein